MDPADLYRYIELRGTATIEDDPDRAYIDVMATKPATATVAVTVRLPADLVARLDALADATERTRSYCLQQALEEVVQRELWQVREVEEALAEDEAHPDEGMPAGDFEAWMIAQGLTTREALDQAAAYPCGTVPPMVDRRCSTSRAGDVPKCFL